MNTELLSNLLCLLVVIVICICLLTILDMIYHRIRFHWTFARYLNDNSRPYFEKEVYDFIKEIRSK